jgi:hypothetical protein
MSQIVQPQHAPLAPVKPAGNGSAVASMVLGIASVVLSFTAVVGLLCGIVAIILGVAGMRRAKLNGQGGGMAVAGLVMGIAGLILSVVFGYIWIMAWIETTRQATQGWDGIKGGAGTQPSDNDPHNF